MEKLLEFIEAKLAPVAEWIGSNKVLGSISTAFNTCLPVIIIGAIFSLLSSLQLGSYQDLITNAGIKNLLVLPPKFTTDLLSLYVVFFVAYRFVKIQGMDGGAPLAGALSLLSFFILTPLANLTVDGNVVSYLSFDYLGSKGLFSALIIGLLVGYIYTFIISHNWIIKMPDGVPPAVSQAFSALIPGFIITFVFLAIHGIFITLTGVSFNEWLYSLIATPLSSLSGSIWTFLLLNFIGSLFWFFGLHGGQIILPFLFVLFMQAGTDNQAAYASGEAMTHILTMSFTSLIMLGGTGQTIGLVIDMCLFSKSKQFKSLGKLSFFPSLCGINEPILFGMPIILNPVMAIPFFIVPELIGIITYFTMQFGLVELPRIAMSAFGTPIFLDGWLICGLSGVILQIILIIFSAVCYYPFLKVQDNIALKAEMKSIM